MRSGWITTGPRVKLLERRLAAYIETGKNDYDTESDSARWSNRVVCLNSATSAEELNLRILGIGEGDEVIIPAYTYTASASAVIHCGATVKFVDIQKDGGDMGEARWFTLFSDLYIRMRNYLLSIQVHHLLYLHIFCCPIYKEP